jgi:hypothetical protein
MASKTTVTFWEDKFVFVLALVFVVLSERVSVAKP